MQSFCPVCAREHRWETTSPLCPCATWQEPQTGKEAQELREMHELRLKLLQELS